MSIPKKIFISSSLVLVIILILWGIYTLSFQKIPEQVAELKNTNTSIVTVPQNKNSSQIEQLSDEAVLSPTLSADGEFVKYYAKSNGKAYAVNISSKNKQVISEKELIGLSEILWSPNKTGVIAKFITATGQPRFSFYDYIKNKGVQLSANVKAVAWQNNEKIFYAYSDSKLQKTTINIANPDGTGWQKISEPAMLDVVVAPIPKTGLVSFWNKPDAFTETLMQSMSVLGGEEKKINTGRFGVDYLWSPNGNLLLISNVDSKGGSVLQIGITNSLGGEYRSLGMPTLVSKCVWSKTSTAVYCSLPGSIPDGIALPNDYILNKFNTNDTFWKIDVKSGEKTRLIDLDKLTVAYDATNLFLDSDESHLFFVNKIDGNLYKITL